MERSLAGMTESLVSKEPSPENQSISISDRYQSYKEQEPIVEGNSAGTGKLVGQCGNYHQYCEACIHMASLL